MNDLFTNSTITVTAEELARRSLRIGAIKLRPTEPFTWASGYRMPIYNDNRMHISHPENRELILSLALDKIEEQHFEESFNAVLAVPSAGIWLAALIAAHYRVPLVIPDGEGEEAEFLVFSGLEKNQKLSYELRYDAIVASYPRALPSEIVFAQQNDMPLLYMRPAPKNHGVGKQIEGDLTGIKNVVLSTHNMDIEDAVAREVLAKANINIFSVHQITASPVSHKSFTGMYGMRFLAIEDLVSTGGSSIKEITKAQNVSAEISDCISVFDYETKAANDAFKLAKVHRHSLLTFSTMLDVATREKFINEYEKELLASWQDDPFGWGEKNGFPKVIKS